MKSLIEIVRFFFIILSFFVLTSCNSQSTKTINESEIQAPPIQVDSLGIEESIFCAFPPEPDIKKWRTYLEKNLELDSASVDSIPSGNYTVLVQFTIGEKGEPKDIAVIKDPGYGLGQRVINVIANSTDVWKPFMVNGKFIKEYCRQSITFQVEEEEKCENKLPAELTL